MTASALWGIEQPDRFGKCRGLSGGDVEGNRRPVFSCKKVDLRRWILALSAARERAGAPETGMW